MVLTWIVFKNDWLVLKRESEFDLFNFSFEAVLFRVLFRFELFKLSLLVRNESQLDELIPDSEKNDAGRFRSKKIFEFINRVACIPILGLPVHQTEGTNWCFLESLQMTDRQHITDDVYQAVGAVYIGGATLECCSFMWSNVWTNNALKCVTDIDYIL